MSTGGGGGLWNSGAALTPPRPGGGGSEAAAAGVTRGPARELRTGLFLPWEAVGRGGEGWLGLEMVGLSSGKESTRGSALGMTMGMGTVPMGKGNRGAREELGWKAGRRKSV